MPVNLLQGQEVVGPFGAIRPLDPRSCRGDRETRGDRMTRRRIGWLGGLLTAMAIAAQCHAQSVLGYHRSPDRGGNFVVPGLTWERAGSLHLDAGFHP